VPAQNKKKNLLLKKGKGDVPLHVGGGSGPSLAKKKEKSALFGQEEKTLNHLVMKKREKERFTSG